MKKLAKINDHVLVLSLLTEVLQTYFVSSLHVTYFRGFNWLELESWATP